MQTSVVMATAESLAGKISGKVVMSGIQPTGVFHLGNILGAVQAWNQLAQQSHEAKEVVYMVADLHSLTVAKPPDELKKLRWEALASLIACGLDPAKCNLYFQSQVAAHARLHWLLSSVSNMGYLSRMVQWKSKAGLNAATSINQLAKTHINANIGDVNLALFSYPVLQAADVLVNNADIVPVGEDQAQHLELTRHVANTFNFKWGPMFQLPQTVLTPFKRVLSLRDPTKKMSKSDSDQSGCIYITDDEAKIASKLQRAVTDSIQGPISTYDPTGRPGVSNLVLIASGLLGSSPQKFLDKFEPQNHKQLKDLVTQVVASKTGPINKEYQRLVQDRSYLEKCAKEGALKAEERCSKVYEEAARRVGF